VKPRSFSVAQASSLVLGRLLNVRGFDRRQRLACVVHKFQAIYEQFCCSWREQFKNSLTGSFNFFLARNEFAASPKL
jgi:hypothetical protein